MPLKINDTNYSEYKKVFEIICRHQLSLLPPNVVQIANPIDVLNAMEQKSSILARRGLRAGLSDSLSALNHLSAGMLQKIDADLKKNNLPSVAVLTSVVKNTMRKVLKKKRISAANEYYMIKEFLMAPDGDLSEHDRNLLYQYLEEFELTKS
jgi:hypothetical protein